jgi:thiamine biosynthesis protein ThiI
MRMVVHYHELGLKGKNAPFFVQRLARNLRRATSDLGRVTVVTLPGRLLVQAEDKVSPERLQERVSSVFGVATYLTAVEAPLDLPTVKRMAVEAVLGRTFSSFRVTTKRSFKGYPLNSGEIDRELGATIQQATGVRVSLESPDLTVFVEVLRDRILIALERGRGPGGFPVGSSGKVLALLSGGIDSPVAAYRMMKRGCTVGLVHFHAFPLQDRSTIDKSRELARILARYQFRIELRLVPFAEIQQSIVAGCPSRLRVVLYRRFMVRVAEALALRRRAKALVTGECLAQVASQTLDNLRVIDAAAAGPILRPLVSMDKQEIIDEARRIGSFPVSILPDQDCCQLYVPRSVELAANIADVEKAESALDGRALVERARKETTSETFYFPEQGPESVKPRVL